VARRVRAQEEVAGAAGGNRAVRYKPCLSVTQAAAEAEAATAGEQSAAAVYLHPRSALRSAPPDWVVYTELLSTGARPYMLGVTALDPRWLAEACPAMTAVDPVPRAQPPATYDARADAVLSWHDAAYGPARWSLPPLQRRTADVSAAAAAFAAALLSGAVLSPMAQLRGSLAAPPEEAARPEAQSRRRVGELVHALVRRRVASRAALAAAWREQPRFLAAELGGWMRAGSGHALERLWPRLLAAAEEPACIHT
jgi:ATP-dependent RNA helicase DHX37/DHR1